MSIRILIASLILLTASALSQNVTSAGPYSIPSTGGGSSCTPSLDLSKSGTIGIGVGSTVWSGTLQAVLTIGNSASNVSVTPYGSSTSQSTITANGTYWITVAAGNSFQICGATVTSGSASISLNGNQQTSKLGSSSGSSAFSAITSGTNTNALVIGSGGSLSTSGSGTITATNGTPSGTQGCPLVNSSGSTTYATSCPTLQSTSFTGSDTGTAIQAALAAAATSNSTGVVIDARGELGTRASESGGQPLLAVNPYFAASAPASFTILMPCGVTLTNVPIILTNGIPVPGNVANHSNVGMQGCGPMGQKPGATPVAGSTLLANAGTFLACESGATAGTGGNACTVLGSATIAASAVTPIGSYSQTVTLTVGGSGLTFSAANLGDEVMVWSGANVIYGILGKITDSTHAIITENPGYQSAIAATANWIIKAPLTGLGIDSQSGTPSATYGIVIQNMTLGCNQIAGCDAGMNWFSAEQSKYANVIFQGYTDIGLDVEGGQAQDSGPYEHLFFGPYDGGTSGCVATTIDFVDINTAVREVHDVSFANGHGCTTSATPQNIAFLFDSNLSTLKDLHFENKGIGLALGYANTVCDIKCPLAVPATIAGVNVDRIDGSCANHVTGACTALVEVGTAATVEASNIRAVVQGVNQITDTFIDQQNSNTLTPANNLGFANYDFDIAGKVSFTDANPADALTNVAIDCYNGKCAFGGSSLGLSAVTAATANTTIANGNFNETWNGALTTDAQDIFDVGETSAAINGTLTNGLANQAVVALSTATNSTATPLEVAQGSVTNTVATPVAQFEALWNNASLTGEGLLFNVTNTASATTSRIIDFRANNTGVFTVDPLGNAYFGTAPVVTTPGTGAELFGVEGTEPASIASGSGFVMDSTAHCPIAWFNTANKGCVGALSAAQTWAAINTFTAETIHTPAARTSGVLPYWQITIPTDTGQTAGTESPGILGVTGTRTWATTGTIALQREIFFPGPTYASASASQTFTDAFNMYLTPPVAGSNAIFTRGHTLGIVDATSAASSITGGLVVATTLGTAATSVGIGGGNVNAGGTVTGAGLALSGTGPTITTPGTTPYLSMNTLTQLTLDGCKLTAVVNMTVTGTHYTICSWTLPATATTWAWQCSGTYTTSTSSDTFALGYTAAQAPVGVNGNAIIYSTLTGTSTAGSVTSTTSTSNQTILTGASVSNVTNEPWSSSGVIQSNSGTSGTFLLTGTLTGTTPSGSVNPGTTCVIY